MLLNNNDTYVVVSFVIRTYFNDDSSGTNLVQINRISL